MNMYMNESHITDESVDLVIVAIAGPGSIVSPALKCLYVLQGRATHLGNGNGCVEEWE